MGISTYKNGKTNIDLNLGYYPIDVSGSDFGDDHWFAGCALRRELTTEWTIFAESYALLPHTHRGGNSGTGVRILKH